MGKHLSYLSWRELLKNYFVFIMAFAVILFVGNNVSEYFVSVNYSVITIQSPKIYSKFYQSFHKRKQSNDTTNRNVSFVKKDDASTEGNNLKSEWIETLNYTVDYGDKTCKENRNGNPLKSTFVKILRHWKSIADKHNIPYFLTYGSLIGAVRDSNFIPYDGDVDIMVDDSCFEALSNISNERNFTSSASDSNIYFVVQPYWRNESTTLNKKRVNCNGKVI